MGFFDVLPRGRGALAEVSAAAGEERTCVQGSVSGGR